MILLFSAGGYHPFISLLQQKADRQLESLLDEEHMMESRLIGTRAAEYALPATLHTGYERHYGNIEVEGQSYTYVKKKIDGDVVIFQCIPNHSRQQLKDMRYDLTRANSNIASTEQGPQKQSPPTLIKNSLSDFDDQLNSIQQHKLTLLKNNFNDGYLPYLTDLNGTVPHAPPEC